MPEYLDHMQALIAVFLAGSIMRDAQQTLSIAAVENIEPTGFDIVFESGFILRIDVSVKQKQGGDQC